MGAHLGDVVNTHGRNLYCKLTQPQQLEETDLVLETIGQATVLPLDRGCSRPLLPAGSCGQAGGIWLSGAMVAVNQQLPLLREKQQALWRCPVGQAEMQDKPALGCANLNTVEVEEKRSSSRRKKGGVLPLSRG